MFKKIGVIVVVSFSVLTGGCAQVSSLTGAPQSTDDLSGKIKVGKTTRSEVIKILGNPDTDNTISGNEIMTYSISNSFGKASTIGSAASSVMGYIPVLSSVSGYAAQATSAAGHMSKTKHVNITLKENIVQNMDIIEN